jgi:hypothetical protein
MKDYEGDQDVDRLTVLKWILRVMMRWHELDFSGSGYGPLERSCDDGNELSDSIERSEVLE